MGSELRKVCFLVLKCDGEDEASRNELEKALEFLRKLERWEIEKITVLTE